MSKVRTELEDYPKREAILDAALDLFAAKGYHGTTVPEVADRAEVGAGTVYRYFESKEALVNALYQKWKTELGRMMMRDFPYDQPIRAQFHELWKRVTQFATQHGQALDFLELHHHGDYLDAKSLAVEKELLVPVHAFAIHAQEQQMIKMVQPEMLGALVWGAFMGLVTAARKGLLELNKKTLDVAEECMWEAIRR
jgi:AcrR family transcriptional regulator